MAGLGLVLGRFGFVWLSFGGLLLGLAYCSWLSVRLDFKLDFNLHITNAYYKSGKYYDLVNKFLSFEAHKNFDW